MFLLSFQDSHDLYVKFMTHRPSNSDTVRIGRKEIWNPALVQRIGHDYVYLYAITVNKKIMIFREIIIFYNVGLIMRMR